MVVAPDGLDTWAHMGAHGRSIIATALIRHPLLLLLLVLL